MYQELIASTLKITKERAILVEAYLRLQYGALDSLSRIDIRREYRTGISEAIDADVESALKLAETFGLKA